MVLGAPRWLQIQYGLMCTHPDQRNFPKHEKCPFHVFSVFDSRYIRIGPQHLHLCAPCPRSTFFCSAPIFPHLRKSKNQTKRQGNKGNIYGLSSGSPVKRDASGPPAFGENTFGKKSRCPLNRSHIQQTLFALWESFVSFTCAR